MGHRLRLALFIGLIVGPTGVLTFLSLRAAVDEQHSALADLRVRMPAMQAALRGQLQQVVEQVLVDTAWSREQTPEVAFVFALEPSGAFASPPLLRPVLLDRSVGFAEALQRAERLEFQATDPLRSAASLSCRFGIGSRPG